MNKKVQKLLEKTEIGKKAIVFPDKSILELTDEYKKAIKTKAKQNKINPNTALGYMLGETMELWLKKKTLDKFGYQVKLEKTTKMSESANNVIYSYIRTALLKMTGEKVGVRVMTVEELMKEKKGAG